MNYVAMDTSNIALWVSVCVQGKNMNVEDFCFGNTLKLYGKLIKVSSLYFCI